MQRRSAVSAVSDRSTVSHRGYRRHHLARLLLVQVEDARQHSRLARVELTAARAARYQELQVLGGGGLVEIGPRVHPDHPQQRVRGGVQQPDHRVEGDSEPVQSACHPARRGLRVDDRVDLRHLLADGDVQRRRDEVGEDQGDHHRHAVADRVAERILQQAGDRRLAQEADAQRGHRDAELAGRQVLVDAIDLAQHQGGTAHAVVAHLLEPALAGAHEGELRGHEESRSGPPGPRPPAGEETVSSQGRPQPAATSR